MRLIRNSRHSFLLSFIRRNSAMLLAAASGLMAMNVSASVIQLTSASQLSSNSTTFTDTDPVGTVYSSNSVSFSRPSNQITFSRGAGGMFEEDAAGASYGSSGFANGTALVSAGGFQGAGASDPVTISFAVPVIQFGVNVEEFNAGNYYVQYTAYDGATSLGTFQAAAANDPNTLSFEGLTASGTVITKVVFDDVTSVGALKNAVPGDNNLIFGNLSFVNTGGSLQAGQTPEPAVLGLFGLGLVVLALLKKAVRQ